MDHRIDGPADTGTAMASHPDLARLTITATAAPGAPLRVTKFVGYGWSGTRTVPAVHDQVAAALAGAVHSGWDGLLDEQRAYLDRFWAAADIEIDGRRGASAGGAFRPVSYPPGGSTGRAAGDSRPRA